MTVSQHYVIRGGLAGRERLRLLSRVLSATTGALFDRVGLREGWHCLDMGCGGGDVTLELARRVGPSGRVVGADLDATKLELAREEAAQLQARNVEYRQADIRECASSPEFDLVYARFLLTHLSDSAGALEGLCASVRPGGLVVLEDIDFGGHFTYPECRAAVRYHELYCATVRRRGGDPEIGRRLPVLLAERGLENVEMCVVQPIATVGEAKLLNPITLENIAGAVLEDNLATRQELDELIRELYEFAAHPRTVAGTPRIVQTWGRKPGGA